MVCKVTPEPSWGNVTERRYSTMKFLLSLQTELALQLDAMSLWVASLNRLFKERPNIFQNNFRRGELFNNGSKGLDCAKYPAEHWEHGKLLMHTLKSVSQ